VIQAGAIGQGGEVLVLDMGEPVQILQVAEQLIAQARRPIKIEFTGLRPGEKLHEVLLAPEESVSRILHPLISHVNVPALEPAVVSGIQSDSECGVLIAALRNVASSSPPQRLPARSGRRGASSA
jgi:FlaA1/EpsC-like NDP-sugar epimerase